MTENDQNICKLLTAIASGMDAQTSRHNVIFKGAVDAISRLTAERDGMKAALDSARRHLQRAQDVRHAQDVERKKIGFVLAEIDAALTLRVPDAES